MMMLNMNRSSCASGSGYVPSSSIGFCVAKTWKGSSSLYVLPCTVTRCSCIASSSADCVFGGVRLISSASTMLAKIGPGVNTMLPATGLGIVLDDVGAGDVARHQVGRELDARELEVEHLRHRVDEQRLRQAGHADDETVAAGEQRQQHELDDVFLPDDQLVQLGEIESCPALSRSASAMSS